MSINKIKRKDRDKTLKKITVKENNDRDQGFESPYSDLSEYRYTRSWEQGLYVNVYGFDVDLPDMPPHEEIVNYGKPLNEQVFRKTLIPKDLQYWDEDEKEAFIEREHHRRSHGMWYFIKGEPVYITGVFYYFMNYWTVQTGKSTKFHMGDWKFFTIWMHVVMSPWIYGLLVFKCRRVGDTEKGLCIVYEYATRVKNTINQLYDCRTETDMKKTFKRLKKAHKNMVWFMKPVTKFEDPQSSFEFTEGVTKQNLAQSYIDDKGAYIASNFEYPSLESEITYYTNEGGADGARVGRQHVDEFGKFNQIDPTSLWALSKKALEDDREGELIGKSLFTSTIEELVNGKTLSTAKKMWDNADPATLDDLGRTVSGLIRIVRGALDREKPDRFGHVDEEKAINKIMEHQAFLIKNKKWIDLISYKRQNCLDIKDVFSNISKGSPFNLENINNRHNELTYDKMDSFVQGNLGWVDGKRPVLGDPDRTNKNCKVFFQPHEKGRWHISAHPKDFGLEENSQKSFARIPVPGNTRFFSCGIDPVSYKGNLDADDRSLAGLAIKRNLDHRIDNPTNTDLYDEKGEPIDGGRFFKTNRYCCVYWYRHDNPSDNYNDWLLSMVYYGTDFLIEKNHSAGFNNYLESMGFLEYYQEKSGMKNHRGQEEKEGLTAGEKVIENYFSAITVLTEQFCNTIDMPIITEQLQTMEYDTRTKHDLGVAIGYCEIAANSKVVDIIKQNEYEEEEGEGMEYTEVHYH